MIVGTARIVILTRGVRSLKEKRRIVKSMKERLAHRFNASVAEVESHDDLRQGVLGVAVIGREAGTVQSVLDKMVLFCRRSGEEIADWDIEIW